MKFIITASVPAAVLAAALLAPASAATSSLSSADHEFLLKAAQGNAAEAALGEVAAQKATMPAVQEFGRWMHTDHTMANQQLMATAQAIHEPMPPAEPSAEQQSDAQALQKLSGAKFDQQYIQHMVADHKQDVDDYQKEASASSNPMLKAYAQALLPVIQAHLEEAQHLASLGQRAEITGAPGTSTTGTSTTASK